MGMPASRGNGTALAPPLPRESHQKAYASLEKLLALVETGKTTGEAYLRLHLNQGGITKVRFAIEGEAS